MESSAQTTDALVRPWRTATIVASLVAAIELLVLIGIVAAFYGDPVLDWAQGAAEQSSAPSKKPEPQAAAAPQPSPPAAAPSAPRLSRAETSVLVLNGNGVSGAAAAAGEVVRGRGYLVASVGNASRSDYRRSVVMYRPGFAPEAARFARDLRVEIVSPLDGLRRKDLMGAHVAIVIGAD